MSGIFFYVLDLETNGIRWKNNFHEISELSIMRASDGMQLTRQVKVIHPENSSIDALNITKKSMADLKCGISPTRLIEEVEHFLIEDDLTPAHRCLVGHNIIQFDRRFLWNLWERHKKQFPFHQYLDTIHMFKAAAKKRQLIKPKFNLTAACDILEIKKVAGQHNAKSDTRNCFLLWQKLMDEVDYLNHIQRIPHNQDDQE